jgi:thymidylate synthase
MRSVIQAIRRDGARVESTKGPNREITGVLLELTDPRARLSRSETRGRPFSCLGELCWYLAQTNRLDFIEYYLPKYDAVADGDVIFGGYGPRLFNWRGLNQVDNVIRLLSQRQSTRQAVIQLFEAEDIIQKHQDVPCTCTIQLMIRDNSLSMLTSMRSNDAYIGLPHDIFCFTMLQEIIARSLEVDIGSYKHSVGSMHLYEVNENEAAQFLNEGWQSTEKIMPAMPLGDQWASIEKLKKAESLIRTEGASAFDDFVGLDSYWTDLIRLLQIFRCAKDRNREQLVRIRDAMSTSSYNTFIDKKLAQM